MSIITVDNYLPVPAGTKYYTRRDDDVYHPIEGALSFSFYERTISIERNYRDNADAAFLGDTLIGNTGSIQPKIAVPGAPTSISISDPVPASIPLNNGSPIIMSLPDEIVHKEPRDETVTLTYRIFWDTAIGSGNVIAMLPEFLFGGFSTGIPVRF